MLFPGTFRKVYLAAVNNGALYMQTSGSTDLLTAGELGIYTSPNNIEGNAISTGTSTDCKIVGGSWHTVDSIAQFYGGLQMPIMSPLIHWGNVTRFVKMVAQTAQQQIVTFGWNQSSASTTGPLFYCGTPYFLKIDFLGAPVLRLLNHQGYVNLPAYGACCGTDCSSGCTSTTVDAGTIMLQWKDFVTGTQMPYLSSFMTPNVYVQNGTSKTEIFSAQDTAAGRGTGTYTPNTNNPSSVVATIQFTGAYQETTFGECTFTPTDYFNLQPVQILGTLVTQDYSPCAVNTTINTSVPNMYTQLQAPRQARGLGQQVRRDWILSNRYLLEDFSDGIYTDDIRMRGIEDSVAGFVSLSTLYDQIALTFNYTQTRHNNPTGMNDNDEYVLLFNVPTGTSTTSFTTLIAGCLTAVSSNVTLETL